MMLTFNRIFHNMNSSIIPSFCRKINYQYAVLAKYVTIATKKNENVKLNSPEFYSIFTPELKKLDELFKKHDYEVRVVGGAVRDLLLGLRPSDLDFATTANPEQMKVMFKEENIRMLNPRGEKHGTITVRINDRSNFEITSLRTDVYCDGRHAEVEFITDWKKDAARRDLTINSMYLGLDGSVYDYFGGYKDLRERRVLFVGDPRLRIEEDFLRILRYFRFFGRISDDPTNHDPTILDIIKEKSEGLNKISGERIWLELSRILTGRFKKEVITKMLELGLGVHMGLNNISNLDMHCFSKVCSYDEKCPLFPITLISSLLISEEQVENFHRRVKLSSFDRDLAYFLILHKFDDDNNINIDHKLKSLQCLLECTEIMKSNMQKYIVELLKFKNEEELLNRFETMKVPEFPIPVHKISEISKLKNKQKNIHIRNELVKQWFLADFKLSNDELINLIPEIMISRFNRKIKTIV